MAYETVNDCDTTISLGGTNRKTGKANPTKIEGYYKGFREVTDTKKASGKGYLYLLKTAQGIVGVWGKTDLDKKMGSVPVNAAVRITSTGTRPTPKGEMYTFKVEVDKSNTDVEAEADAFLAANDEDIVDTDLDDDATQEVSLPIGRAAGAPAPTPSPQTAKALLAKRSARTN